MVLFRLGSNLVTGRLVSESDDVVKLLVQGDAVSLDPSFVINREYESEVSQVPFSRLVHESVMPFITSGRSYKMETSSVVAYQRHARGVGFLTENTVSWVPLNNILTHREFGSALALEALKPKLESLGLISLPGSSPVTEVTTVLHSPLFAYMKTDPFRDITELKEGIAVGISGYYKGCVVVEADVEEFWIPVEERNEYQPAMKDDWYYFGNQDSDADKIQDPLQMLPSKAALAQTVPATSEDNWNITPDLRKTAGHFAPIPNIKMESHAGVLVGESGLTEFLGTQGYEEFERLHQPKRHDKSVQPGLEPEQEDEEPSDEHADDIERMAAQDLSQTGPDAVPHDYTGEYGKDSGEVDDGTDATTIDKVLDHVIEGADLGAILDAASPNVYEKVYKEEFKKVFPDVDLS